MAEWRKSVRPREERILALSARLELSRQALSGLQEKMGHRVCGVVGALEAVKDHLPSSTSEPMQESLALAFRVADLEALQQSLMEKENNELRELYGEMISLHDRAIGEQASSAQPTDEQQQIATQQLERLKQDQQVAGASVQDPGHAHQAVASLRSRIADLEELLRSKTEERRHADEVSLSQLAEQKSRVAELNRELVQAKHEKELAESAAELARRNERSATQEAQTTLQMEKELNALRQQHSAAARQHTSDLEEQRVRHEAHLAELRQTVAILEREKQLAEAGALQTRDKLSAAIIGPSEREFFQSQVQRLMLQVETLTSDASHWQKQAEAMKISHSEMHANLEDRLHEQNEALKAKTLALEDQRQQHLVEIDLLKKHHAARLDSSAARYERSAAEFQHALDTLQQEKAQAETARELSREENRSEDLQDRLRGQSEALRQLTLQVDEHKARLSELTQNLVIVNQEKVAAETRAGAEIARLNDQLRVQSEALQSQSTGTAQLLRDKQTTEEALRIQHTAAIQAQAQRIAQLEADIAKASQVGADNRSVELQSTIVAATEAEDRMRELEKHLNAAQLKCETLQRAAGDAEQKLQAFEVQQLAIVRERDQVREERDRQARELQRAQERLAELDELRLAAEVTSKELVDAKSRAQSAANRAEAMSQALKTQEVAKQATEESLSTLQESEAALKHRVLEMENAMGAARGLESELQEVRARMEKLMDELSSAEKASEHMKKVIGTMRKDMALQQSRAGDMEGELSVARARCEELETSVARLRDAGLEAQEEQQTLQLRLQALAKERDVAAGQKMELQKMVGKLSAKIEDLLTEANKRNEMEAHNAQVMARLQQKNNEYKESREALEKDLASIEEEKQLILANMAETLAAGSDAEMAVRNLSTRLSEQAGTLHERTNTIELLEAELMQLREYSSDRDSLHTRLLEAEQRLLIADASIVTKDAELADKEEKLAERDAKISQLVGGDDMVERSMNTSEHSKGPSVADRKDGLESELEEAKATISALQGQVDQLSEMWAEVKAQAASHHSSPERASSQQCASHPTSLPPASLHPSSLVPTSDRGQSPGSPAKAPELLRRLPQEGGGIEEAGCSSPQPPIAGLREAAAAVTTLEEGKRALNEALAALEETQSQLVVKTEMLKQCQSILDEQQGKLQVYEEELKTFAGIRRDIEEGILAPDSETKKETERLQKEVTTLIEHNTTLAAALKNGPRQDEVERMEQQLAQAIQRGTEIQAEKDEAVRIAMESVGEVESYRARLVQTQERTVKRILSHWKDRHCSAAWTAWVQVYETAKTDNLLADTMGVAADDEIERLLLKFQG